MDTARRGAVLMDGDIGAALRVDGADTAAAAVDVATIDRGAGAVGRYPALVQVGAVEVALVVIVGLAQGVAGGEGVVADVAVGAHLPGVHAPVDGVHQGNADEGVAADGDIGVLTHMAVGAAAEDGTAHLGVGVDGDNGVFDVGQILQLVVGAHLATAAAVDAPFVDTGTQVEIFDLLFVFVAEAAVGGAVVAVGTGGGEGGLAVGVADDAAGDADGGGARIGYVGGADRG